MNVLGRALASSTVFTNCTPTPVHSNAHASSAGAAVGHARAGRRSGRLTTSSLGGRAGEEEEEESDIVKDLKRHANHADLNKLLFRYSSQPPRIPSRLDLSL